MLTTTRFDAVTLGRSCSTRVPFLDGLFSIPGQAAVHSRRPFGFVKPLGFHHIARLGAECPFHPRLRPFGHPLHPMALELLCFCVFSMKPALPGKEAGH